MTHSWFWLFSSLTTISYTHLNQCQKKNIRNCTTAMKEIKDIISFTHKTFEGHCIPRHPLFCKTEQVFPNSSRFFDEPLEAKLWTASYNYPGRTGLAVCWFNKQGHVQLSEWWDESVINQEFRGLLPVLIWSLLRSIPIQVQTKLRQVADPPNTRGLLQTIFHF